MATELKLSTDLIELVQPNALDTFIDREKVDAIIAMVAEKANAALQNLKDVGLYDASTEEGRAAIKALAFKVTKSKTALEGIGKGLAAEAKELPKKIDAGRGRFDEELVKLAKQIRAPVTEWETKDEDRKLKHLAKIEGLKGYVAGIETDQETIRGLLAAAEAVVVGPENEEFEDGYRLAKENAVSGLATALAARIKFDADQVELAALREKQKLADDAEVERLRLQGIREREQVVAQEATDKANREALAAHNTQLERVQRESQAAADLAARLAQEAERKSNDELAAIKERQRQEAEAKAADEAETKRREASTLNRKKIGGQAAAALMLKVEGLTEEMALSVVRAIAKGEIPHLKVEW